MSLNSVKQHVLLIPDGAADLSRVDGRSPLMLACTDHSDFLARQGVSGRLQTLYPDLSRGSVVAQLGMLGWDPYLYYPNGRASCELQASGDFRLADDDLVLRVNLVTMDGRRLVSYNGNYVRSERARPLVEKLNAALAERFPAFELRHSSDFRNVLIVRGAGVDPRKLHCPEPHECEGQDFDVSRLISGRDDLSSELARGLNAFVAWTAEVLADEPANMLIPWSPSQRLQLSKFADNTGFEGKAAIVGCMEFLQGIARAGGIDFLKVGNGGPDTDFQGKGKAVMSLLDDGYSFVVCHVNAPDEASHMGDLWLKVRCIEAVDRAIVGPVVEYFRARPERLGSVMIAPDHYTNSSSELRKSTRADAHSLDPVPFALWNGHERDGVESFDEDSARAGRYGKAPLNHLDLLGLAGVSRVATPGVVRSW